MTPKRGDRAAPPPPPGGYTLKFATSDAAKGWEELCRVAAANLRTAYQTLESNPCPNRVTTRHHQLKGELSTAAHGGRSLPQWQYEVTGAGRIWYLVDHEARVCWLKHASTGHPKATE